MCTDYPHTLVYQSPKNTKQPKNALVDWLNYQRSLGQLNLRCLTFMPIWLACKCLWHILPYVDIIHSTPFSQHNETCKVSFEWKRNFEFSIDHIMKYLTLTQLLWTRIIDSFPKWYASTFQFCLLHSRYSYYGYYGKALELLPKESWLFPHLPLEYANVLLSLLHVSYLGSLPDLCRIPPETTTITESLSELASYYIQILKIKKKKENTVSQKDMFIKSDKECTHTPTLFFLFISSFFLKWKSGILSSR